MADDMEDKLEFERMPGADALEEREEGFNLNFGLDEADEEPVAEAPEEVEEEGEETTAEIEETEEAASLSFAAAMTGERLKSSDTRHLATLVYNVQASQLDKKDPEFKDMVSFIFLSFTAVRSTELSPTGTIMS